MKNAPELSHTDISPSGSGRSVWKWNIVVGVIAPAGSGSTMPLTLTDVIWPFAGATPGPPFWMVTFQNALSAPWASTMSAEDFRSLP